MNEDVFEGKVYERGTYRLIHGDCLDVMSKMGDASVDVVFTSPPYNDSGKTDRDIEKGRHIKYDAIEFREDWFEWQSKCIDETMRIGKQYVLYNVQAILSNKKDVYKIIGKYADAIHMILMWYKPNAQPQPYAHRVGNSYEMVIIFKCKGFDRLEITSERYSNVIVQNINADHRYSEKHRALMSVPFADEIIREFTRAGWTVFDPFMGLATTGISCLKQGRNFVGCEINREYFEMAKKRLIEETGQMSIADYMDSIGA